MMKRHVLINRKRGMSLIELILALCVSSLVLAGIYRLFIGSQKAYNVQEQVVEMQQNARFAVQKMLMEIRMAGFGNVASLLPLSGTNGPFQNIINPVNNVNLVNRNDDQVTIVEALDQIASLAQETSLGTSTLLLAGNPAAFNLNPAGNNKYISIGGIESHTVTSINSNTITLKNPLTYFHKAGTPVYKVKAITYRLGQDATVPTMTVLMREDNTDGGGPQVVADNIDNLQFNYTLSDGSKTDSPATPGTIRIITVDLTAKTDKKDLEYKENDGYRTRQIISDIKPRNIALSP